MFCTFDSTLRSEISGQEGVTVAAPMLALFDPDGSQDRQQRAQESGRDWTVADLIDAYLEATEAAENTRASYATTRRRWAEWLAVAANVHRSPTPMHIRSVTADLLVEWLDWVYREAQSAGDNNPANTCNKRRREMHAVLTWACRRRYLDALPAFPDERKQRTVAGHYFLTDEEMERLYWATYQMRRPHKWTDARSIGALWRCALVLFRNYGFDTQILMPYARQAASILTWATVRRQDALPPGRVANCPNECGWLVVRRQKTGRNLFLPLEPVVAAHLDAIRPADAKPDDPVLGYCGGGRPCQRFQELCRLAKLTDKWDVDAERVTRWELKDLRKTCATAHNANRPGSAMYVLGHSSGTITDQHYANALPLVLEAVRTLPQPAAFRSIVDPTIRPPVGGLLFAK